MFEKDKSGYFDLVRTDALRLLPGANWASVLEVGCGEGLTLEYLKANYSVIRTTGVEIDQDSAARAKKRVDRIINCSAESMDSELASESFDLVLCLDVLEHLYDPWAVVKTLQKHLKSGGYLLASIPNVQHWSVVRKLLTGKWDYTKAGLMDETHIRFFTEKSIRRLFNQANLKILRCEGQMGKAVKILDALTLKLWHGFFSYQFFVLTQKVE